MKISLFDIVENTEGRGENAGYLHFLLFPRCFHSSSLGSLKVRIMWERVQGKGEMLFTAFLTMFSKGFLPKVLKSCHFVVRMLGKYKPWAQLS